MEKDFLRLLELHGVFEHDGIEVLVEFIEAVGAVEFLEFSL